MADIAETIPLGNKQQRRRSKLTARTGSAAAKLVAGDDHLIDGILPSGPCLITLYGAPGSTKSFWCVAAAIEIARGGTLHGRQCKQGGVIYCALEGSGVFSNRVLAYCLKHNLNPDVELGNFALVTDPLDLRDRASQSTSELLLLAEELGGVRLIIVDTLARSFGGGNENSPEDMGLLLGNAGRLASETGAAVMLVHHTGKDTAAGMRGHSSLLGATDCSLKVTRSDAGSLLTLDKMRDAEDGVMFAYRAELVPLGHSANGREITSLAVVGAPVEDVRPKPVRRLGELEHELLRQVELLVAEPSAKLTPVGIGWPGSPVRMCLQADVIDRALKNLDVRAHEATEKRRRMYKALKRLTTASSGKQVLGRNEGWLWKL